MYQTLDPTLIRQLIRQETDVITPAVKEEEKLYENARCPVCYQTGCVKRLNQPRILETPEGPRPISTPFSSRPIVEGYAHCLNCDSDFDPRTGLILRGAPTIVSPP